MTRDELLSVQMKHLEQVEEISQELHGALSAERRESARLEVRQLIIDGYASFTEQWVLEGATERDAYCYVVGYAKGRVE